jgi:hypothetical protein
MDNQTYNRIYESLKANPTIQANYASIMDATKKTVYKPQTTFPSITSTEPLDRKKYLCYIAGLAGLEDVDPVIAGEPDFAIDAQRPDFESLQSVGDPRFTLGTLLSSVYQRYERKIELLVDIQRAGGCQVIENYICTEDGTPVKEVSDSCRGVDTTPMDVEEVISFVTVSYNQAIVSDADGFVNFLQTEYLNKGWSVFLYTYADIPLFFVRTNRQSENKFFRYYYEQKDYVATSLNLTISTATQELIQPEFQGVNQALLAPIPSYASYDK